VNAGQTLGGWAGPGEAALGRAPCGQRDTDTLPPYEVLDPLIEDYVKEDYRSPTRTGARAREGPRVPCRLGPNGSSSAYN
jgi:hypothetical protein